MLATYRRSDSTCGLKIAVQLPSSHFGMVHIFKCQTKGPGIAHILGAQGRSLTCNDVMRSRFAVAYRFANLSEVWRAAQIMFYSEVTPNSR